MKRLKNRTKKNLILFLVLTALALTSACGSAKSSPTGDGEGKESDSSGSVAGTETPVSTDKEEAVKEPGDVSGETQKKTPGDDQGEKPTKDPSGADIAIPREVENVAALAPSIVETLIDLGCADNIIAIDTQTQMNGYEQLSAELPAFDMMTPDTEQLAALKPDVIFISGMTGIGGTDPYSDLKELGICVIDIPSSESIQGVKDDIAFLAACMGKSKEGEDIIAGLTEEINRIGKIGETITDKKSVYFEIAAAPSAYSFGSGTFLNEMIEIIGAENILSDQQGWTAVDMESIVAANPDVILTSVNYIENPVDEILSREGWGEVSAVSNREVFYIDTQSSTLPNENIVKALAEMARAVYPDVYGE